MIQAGSYLLAARIENKTQTRPLYMGSTQNLASSLVAFKVFNLMHAPGTMIGSC